MVTPPPPRSRCLATVQEGSASLAAHELDAFGWQATVFAPGVFLVEGQGSVVALARAAATGAMAFVRNLVPITFELPPACSPEDLSASVSQLGETIQGKRFVVHVRPLSTVESETRRSFRGRLEEMLSRQGGILARAAAEIICTVVLTPDRTLVGIAAPELALSTWPGGEPRYRVEPGQISRAEHKLLEALEVFKINVEAGTRALDLGAAPGGWSRILADRGAAVTAVDPAMLDDRLIGDHRIIHFRGLAQEILQARRDRFGIITNDMRMDPVESALLTCKMKSVLEPGGSVVMTFKLPRAEGDTVRAIIREARQMLEREYSVLGMRQLFHNRSEVTLHLKNDRPSPDSLDD